MSRRKEHNIYAAVHDAVMTLRIELSRSQAVTAAIDAKIAQAGHAAGMAAIAAYRAKLPRKRSRE